MGDNREGDAQELGGVRQSLFIFGAAGFQERRGVTKACSIRVQSVCGGVEASKGMSISGGKF